MFLTFNATESSVSPRQIKSRFPEWLGLCSGAGGTLLCPRQVSLVWVNSCLLQVRCQPKNAQLL